MVDNDLAGGATVEGSVVVVAGGAAVVMTMEVVCGPVVVYGEFGVTAADVDWPVFTGSLCPTVIHMIKYF